MSAMLISCEKDRGREKDKQKAMKEYLAELCWPLFDETHEEGRKEGRKERMSERGTETLKFSLLNYNPRQKKKKDGRPNRMTSA